jgi:hypothetical protein
MSVEIEAGPDVYDQMVGEMDSHANDGTQHPCVAHVAAVTADGNMHIVDLWESPEAFGAFAEAEIAPVAGGRIGEIEPRFIPVQNVIRGRSAVTA